MAKHNEIGKVGEQLAYEHLKKQGYTIIEQNYRTRYIEIDVVALGRSPRLQPTGEAQQAGVFSKGPMVFVEVRTKVGEQFGSPEDTINRAKLRKVLRSATLYAGFKRWNGPVRVDAICIVLRPDLSVERLTHHENIVA